MGIRVAASLLVALLASLFCAQADVTFVNYESDYSALKVVLPTPLKTFAGLEGIRHSQALFGAPSYGGDKMIAGELFYVTPGELTGCDNFKEKVPDSVAKGTQMIFLVDRGACDFVQKMRTAQQLGAVAVIIADNVCQCQDYENSAIWSDSSKTGRTLAQKAHCGALAQKAHQEGRLGLLESCERGLPYMADDGTGGDVRIPSFLIDYLDAQPLKDCLESAAGTNTGNLLTGTEFKCARGTKVVVSLEWDLPRKDNRVDWQLWSSSDSEGVFKKSFANTAKKLQQHALFTPHYFLWDGAKWGCNIAEICGSQCTKGGLYCNPDPDHNLFGGVSGRDVVEENLRELCIWDQAKAANNTGLWWDYVVAFANKCHPGAEATAGTFTKTCSIQVQNTVDGLSADKTEKCVTDSTLANGRNAKLDAELEQRANLKILQLPTAVVNGVLLRGGVTPLAILSSLCAGFTAGQSPSLCSCVDRVNSDNLLECINSECEYPQKFCAEKKQCYSREEYAVKCNLCRTNEQYCPTLGQCLPSIHDCPKCPKPEKPTYCPLIGECVESFLQCTPPPVEPSKDGTSAFGVFTITMMVVSMAGCGAYAFWRRQKAKLHEDVRAILSSYMALEEHEGADEGRPSRPMRQVQPMAASSSSSVPPSSPSPVTGQDASSYI